MTARTRELLALAPRILELIRKYPDLPYSAIAKRLGTSQRYVSCAAVKAGIRRQKRER